MDVVGRRTAAAGLANLQLQQQYRYQSVCEQQQYRYQSVCEQQQLAHERNEALLQDLRQFQHQTALATPRTNRLKTLKHCYEEHVAAVYPQWAAQVQEHRIQFSPEQQGTPTETSSHSSSQSHSLPITADGSLLRSPVATAAASSHRRLLSDSHTSEPFVSTVAPGMEDLSAGTFNVSSLPTPDKTKAIPISCIPKPTLLPSSASYLGASVAVHLSGINMIATPSTSSKPIMHTRVIPPGAQLPPSIPPPIITTTAPQQPDPLRMPTEQKLLGSMPYRAPVPSPSHKPSRIPVLASRTKVKLPASSKDTPSHVNVIQSLSRIQVAVREQMTPEMFLADEPERLNNKPSNFALHDHQTALHDHQTVQEQSGEASEVFKSSPPSSQAMNGDKGSQHAMQLECTAVSKVEQEPDPTDCEPQTPDLTVTTEPTPAQLLTDRPHSTNPAQLLTDRPHSTDPAQLLTDRPHSTNPAQLLTDLNASLPSLSDSNQEAAPEEATPPTTPTTPLSLPLAEVPKSLSADHTSILPGESPQPDRLDRQDEGFGHDMETTDSHLPASITRNARDIAQPSHAHIGSAPEGSRNDDLSLHSESSTTPSEVQHQGPQPVEVQHQGPQPVEDTAYSLLMQSMQPPGVSPPSSPLLSEGSEIAEMERQLQASSGMAEGEGQSTGLADGEGQSTGLAEGEGQSTGEPSKQLKSSPLLPPVPPHISSEGSGASQEESESSLSPFSPAYIPTAMEQRSQASAASKASALRRKLGFWGDSDSNGSDLELPGVTPLDNEKEDFDFYG